MAAFPGSLAEGGRRSTTSSESSKPFGRDATGNLHPSDISNSQPVSLDRITIKNDYCTTGLSGSGHTARGCDSKESRRTRDVAAHPHRESESRKHVGRGGAANIFTPCQDEVAAAKREYVKWENAYKEKRKGTRPKGLADKGKEWLFGTKGCIS